MKKIPVYVNPYDKVHFGPSTVMTLHRFGIFDLDVARRVPTLSPFSAKLTAHLRFQGIPFRTRRRAGRWQCAAWKGAFHHGRWRESRRFRPGHRLSEDRLSRSRRRFERPSARCRPPRPAYAGGPPLLDRADLRVL